MSFPEVGDAVEVGLSYVPMRGTVIDVRPGPRGVLVQFATRQMWFDTSELVPAGQRTEPYAEE